MSLSCISFLRCRPFMALMTRRLLWPLKATHLTIQKKYELLKEYLNGLLPGGFHGDILTISWKDVVAESSYKELVTFKQLKKKDFKVIFSWTLFCGIMLREWRPEKVEIRVRPEILRPYHCIVFVLLLQ